MFDIKLIFYDPSLELQFSQFGWMLRYSVQVVFNNFLLIDATDRSKISSDQKRLFFAVCLYPFSFFTNTPFKWNLIAQITLKKWCNPPPRKMRRRKEICPNCSFCTFLREKMLPTEALVKVSFILRSKNLFWERGRCISRKINTFLC